MKNQFDKNIQILKVWEDWKKGVSCLENSDCEKLSKIFHIKFPLACKWYLNFTDNPQSASVSTENRHALTKIFKFISKLEKVSLDKE